MRRFKIPSRRASRGLQALVWAAALTVVGCDSSVKISPTVPEWPDITPIGERNLLISGTLVSERGACLEATVLFDGQELADARVSCPDPEGCTELELAAVTPSASGHHTISFQLLSQSSESEHYVVTGSVVVTRGLRLGGIVLQLGPTSATLQPGESVTFDLDFSRLTR